LGVVVLKLEKMVAVCQVCSPLSRGMARAPDYSILGRKTPSISVNYTDFFTLSAREFF
jgi:hypothetical protein